MNIFDPIVLKELYNNYAWFFNLAVLLIAGLLTYYLIPKVVWVAKQKGLYKKVNSRSSHTGRVPSLGGIAFYIAFVLVVSILQTVANHESGNYLIGAVTIMFIVGVKDDLVVSSARVKLIGQLLATAFIIFSPAMHISSLHGFLGIYEIPSFLGYIISSFIIIAIVNSYNLIDGINGLAGIIGIVISGVYAVAFSLIEGQDFFFLLSLFCFGTLVAFLRFNFSRGHRKIFMGDSGSLMMGFILGVLSVKLLKIHTNIDLIGAGGDAQNRLLFLGAALFIMFFDTSRVMIVRKWEGYSPFRADRNHMHHILLDLGLSHLKTSALLGAFNFMIVAIYFLLSANLSTTWLIVSLGVIYIGLFSFCGYCKKIVNKKVAQEEVVNA